MDIVKDNVIEILNDISLTKALRIFREILNTTPEPDKWHLKFMVTPNGQLVLVKSDIPVV